MQHCMQGEQNYSLGYNAVFTLDMGVCADV